MKNFMNAMLPSLSTLMMTACCGDSSALLIEDKGWPSGCTPGYEKGVSAPYCGVLEGCLISAGGANFPERSVVEGGVKRLYSDIACLKDDNWMKIGELPFEAAYGGCLQHGDRLLTIGGNDGKASFADVLSISIVDGKAHVSPCTSLPYAVEQAGYAIDGDRIFVCGGVSDGKPCRHVLAGDISGNEISWSELIELPELMVQPIVLAHEGRLYVWGGFDPENKKVGGQGWCLDKGADQWRPVSGGKDGMTFTGSSAVRLGDGCLAVIGGVDKEIFTWGINISTPEDRIRYLTMEPSEYRFNRILMIFHPENEEWTEATEAAELALAGAGIATDGHALYVTGGEIKPGVRTPATWKLKACRK